MPESKSKQAATQNGLPAPDSIWRHKNGNCYKVISIVVGKSKAHEVAIEGKDFVLYKPMYGDKEQLYVRLYEEFLDRFSEVRGVD